MNALEKYYGEISDLTEFDPGVAKGAGDAVMAVLADDERNDPTAWVAYAAETMKQAWSGLPKELREVMQGAFDQLIDDAVAGMDQVVEGLQQAKDVAGAAPLIGALFEFAIQIIQIVVETKRGLAASHRGLSRTHKALRMKVTLESYPNPRDWVFKSMKLANYTQYVGSRKQGNWSRQPCFRRAGLLTNRMLAAKPGVPDKGKCGHKKGVKMYCDSRREIGYEDCRRYWKRKDKNPPNYCERHLGISALFYPYWSTAYAMGPIDNANLGMSSDPNGILMNRQAMMLTDPDTNLRVVGKDLLAMTDRFVKFWRQQMSHFAVDGKNALLRIDKEGNALATNKADRFTIDDRMDPDYTWADTLRNRFYFDDDGRILPYQDMDADVSEWGIRAKGGAGAGTDGGTLGVTVGAYNTVVTNTMAFFTARSSMLRNGNRMKGVLLNLPKFKKLGGGLTLLDPAVRSAVQYAADKGGMLPGPAKKKTMLVKGLKSVKGGKHTAVKTAVLVSQVTKPVPPRFSIESVSIDESPGKKKSKKKGGSKLPILLGAAAVGFIVLKKK